MSDYYLADEQARQRERDQQRERGDQKSQKQPKQAQDVKVTLLGDFLFTTAEPPGCDPYNSTNGKTVRDAWKLRRDRR
jgi:hypothetical protein